MKRYLNPQQSRRTRAPRVAVLGRCPMCESGDTRRYFESRDRWQGVQGRFTYRECCFCRTVFQDPQVIADDLALCYPADYYTHVPVESEAAVEESGVEMRRGARLRDRIRQSAVAVVQGQKVAGVFGAAVKVMSRTRGFRERAFWGTLDELIPRGSGSRRALEVGCGAGFLLAELRRIGWRIEGVEVDPEVAEAAQRRSGCKVHVGDLRRLDLPASSFELIVMHHVFEHLDEPLSVLDAAATLLTESGSAVLIYPNRDSLGARLFGQNWIHWDPPRHLVLVPGKAIVAAAQRVGLSCIRIRTVMRWAAKGFAVSRAFRAEQTFESAEVKPVDQLLDYAARILVFSGFDLGEELVVAFRRSSDH